eukprot:Skav208437  [mRNA]  locus=scaffold1952:113640:114347:+ [translate_table: standard]
MAADLVFDCSNLSQEWDDSNGVRERIRKGENLVLLVPNRGKARDANIPQCVLNKDVLLPAVHRLFASQWKLPDINPLRTEVEALYLNNQRAITDAVVDDDSWEIRKMLRLIKRKANRGDPSLASHFEIQLYFFDGFVSIFWSGNNLEKSIAPNVPVPCWLDTQDTDFQDLVLIVNPDLQAWQVLSHITHLKLKPFYSFVCSQCWPCVSYGRLLSMSSTANTKLGLLNQGQRSEWG